MRHLVPHFSRRAFLGGAAAMTAPLARWSFATSLEDSSSPFTLHFAQPASQWPDALPVGNGRLGAMVFGHPGMERIQLNEESIWDGEPDRDRTNPGAAAAIPKIREMLFAGRISEAEALAVSDVLAIPRRLPCYQTLGDLHLDFSPMGLTAETIAAPYRLELDLDTAIVTTRFTHAGCDYRREVFISAPDQIVVVRLTANQPGRLSFHISLDRPKNFKITSPASDRLVMTGQAMPETETPAQPHMERNTGVRFYSELRALCDGGQCMRSTRGDAAALEIRNANAVTLLFDCATSYRYPAHRGKHSGIDADLLTGDAAAMRAAVGQNINAAMHRPYPELRACHIADHQRYFRRTAISFGTDPNASIPTDQRMRKIKEGGEDIHLLPIYFQLGRYMLIASSRPGTLAANLQGIWNESLNPPWGSKYTVNINTEMNYWFAETANLSELHLPLFDLLHATLPQGARTAREMYSAHGAVVHHNTDLWGDACPIDGLGGGVWPMGANWISLHLWQHYAFHRDPRFLADHVYPALRENAVFLLDYLVRDPESGHLVTGPSCSPENEYQLPDGKSYNLCMGPTMDIAITRSVFSRLLECAAHLGHASHAGADAAFLRRVQDALAQLPPYKISPDGRLQEWQQDYQDHEPGHRHISHLFGLFPEDQITPDETPELARAARLVLERRLAAGGGSTGWSRAWIINCYARLQDGEACYASILQLLRHCTRTNLFDVCGMKEQSPFQIDGNLGAPGGIIEMLLQSHGHTPVDLHPNFTASASQPTILRLLPALPSAWATGNFNGLRARGGLEVDLAWAGSKVTTATLRAASEHTYRLQLPASQSAAEVKVNGKPLPFETQPGSMPLLHVEAGLTYTLIFA